MLTNKYEMSDTLVKNTAGIIRNIYAILPDLIPMKNDVVNLQLLQKTFEELNVEIKYTVNLFQDSASKLQLSRGGRRLGQALDELKRCINLQKALNADSAQENILNDHLGNLTICGNSFKTCVKFDYETNKERVVKPISEVMACLDEFIACIERINTFLYSIKSPNGRKIKKITPWSWYLNGALCTTFVLVQFSASALSSLALNEPLQIQTREIVNNLRQEDKVNYTENLNNTLSRIPLVNATLDSTVNTLSGNALSFVETKNTFDDTVVKTRLELNTANNWARIYVEDMAAYITNKFVTLMSSINIFGYGITRVDARVFAQNLRFFIYGAFIIHEYLTTSTFSGVGIMVDQYIASIPVFIIGQLAQRLAQYFAAAFRFTGLKGGSERLEDRFKSVVGQTLEEVKAVSPEDMYETLTTASSSRAEGIENLYKLESQRLRDRLEQINELDEEEETNVNMRTPSARVPRSSSKKKLEVTRIDDEEIISQKRQKISGPPPPPEDNNSKTAKYIPKSEYTTVFATRTTILNKATMKGVFSDKETFKKLVDSGFEVFLEWIVLPDGKKLRTYVLRKP